MTPFPWKQAIGFGLGVLRAAAAAILGDDAARARIRHRGDHRPQRAA